LHVVGQIVCTNDITAFYSDKRLKEIQSNINNPIDIINSLNGIYYNANEFAEQFGFKNKNRQVGLIAQEVQKVLPEIVKIAPFDMASDNSGNIFSKSGSNYLTLSYDKLIPVLVEAIKEQNKEIIQLRKDINEIKKQININSNN